MSSAQENTVIEYTTFVHASNDYINEQGGHLRIPFYIEKIGQAALYDCDDLTSIELGFLVTEIQEEALEGTSIVYLCLPNSIRTIEKRAVANCQNLNRISMYDLIEDMAVDAFEDSCNIDEITIYTTSDSDELANNLKSKFPQELQRKITIKPFTTTSTYNVRGSESQKNDGLFEDVLAEDVLAEDVLAEDERCDKTQKKNKLSFFQTKDDSSLENNATNSARYQQHFRAKSLN